GDERLGPGGFIRIRIQVATRKDATTIPPAAIQRGPDGLYTWVVKNNTVEQRSIQTMPVDNDPAIVTKGVAPGEEIVVNGQYRLDTGTRVSATTEVAANGAGGAP